MQFTYPHHLRCHPLDKGEVTNLTKAGIICCDRIMTVSANYAEEIKTAEGGFLLDGLVRSKAFYLSGVQNGIDYSWNPAKDLAIPSLYSGKDVRGKAVCKRAIQEKLGLAVAPDKPLLVFIGRLTWQKGVDIIVNVLDWLMTDAANGVNGNCQVVMMGNGDECYAALLRQYEQKYPQRVCGYVGFKPDLERLLMAGGDFLLMPSRYEPCGIPQMIALTYGTVPIVHATGGLKDSVADVSEAADADKANGYWVYPLNEPKMKEVLYSALDTFHNHKERHAALQRNGMACDFTWPRAVDAYEQYFDYTLDDPPLYS